MLLIYHPVVDSYVLLCDVGGITSGVADAPRQPLMIGRRADKHIRARLSLSHTPQLCQVRHTESDPKGTACPRHDHGVDALFPLTNAPSGDADINANVMIMATAPPIIDFSSFYTGNASQKQSLVDDIRRACLEKGFFQLTGHGVPTSLQAEIFAQSTDFFALPEEEKMKSDKNLNTYNRGYEHMRAQNFEGKGAGDLKEGFYFGRDLPLDHPSAQKGTFGCGPNVYPEGVSNPAHFRNTIALYHATMARLAQDVLQVLALTLNLSPNAFDEFGENALAILRLLHYPPQPPDASEDERGIGAHTDFGGITLLLQDDVGGLQVYDSPTSTWIDVAPTPGAYVVNLGNLMMRWTNDRYVSNLHRVINTSGRERYSIPFFFSGNPDYVVKCLPGSEEDDKGPKYGPVTVEDWMRGRYAATYGTTDKTESDMVQEAVKS